MKNFTKLFGVAILTMVIIFGFAALSLTGCDNGNGDNSGGGGDTTGTFTIQYIPDWYFSIGVYACSIANYSDFDVIVTVNGTTKTLPRRSTNQPIAENFGLSSTGGSGTYRPANKVRFENQSAGYGRFYNK